MDPEEWLNIRNFGEKSRAELDTKLQALGLSEDESATENTSPMATSEEMDQPVEEMDSE